MFSIKSELNSEGRIIEGALQCYNYLLKNKRGFLCSYIHKWNIYDYMSVRVKRVFCLLFIYFMYFLENYGPMLFGKLYKTELYKTMKSFCTCCFKDFILYKCL